MRRAAITRVLGTALAVMALARVEPARGGGAGPTITEEDILSARDYLPTRADLDAVMGPTPLDALVGRALGEENVRIRVRALRALAHYPSDQAHDTLLLVLDDPSLDGAFALDAGEVMVLRRACLEALGELGDPDDVAVITEYLFWPEEVLCDARDIQAAAAHALRVLGSTTAAPALYQQLQASDCPQVDYAITEALRELVGGT